MPGGCINTTSTVLFSKQGWLLLLRKGRFSPDSLSLVNPFTRARIELPPGPVTPLRRYPAAFTTTTDGYPQCVFIQMLEGHSKAVIKTVNPGDESWTDHTYFSGVEEEGTTSFIYVHNIVTIGHKVYWQDCKLRTMLFSVADDSWKILPPPPSTESSNGFMAEHRGELVFVTYARRDGGCDFRSSEVYKYTAASSSSWERLDKNSSEELKDTSWFCYGDRRCIATRGKGLKAYLIRQKRQPSEEKKKKKIIVNGPYYYLKGEDGRRETWVEVHDLMTGNVQDIPIPFEIGLPPCWVDIG